MLLADHDIRLYNTNEHVHVGHPLVEPYVDGNVQPASLDVTLGNDFYQLKESAEPQIVDPLTTRPEDLFKLRTLTDGETFTLPAGGFALGTTREYFKLPATLSGHVMGKSSLARLGLFVHVTAGFVDPGFQGRITLEFYNALPHDMILTPGMPIGQLGFIRLTRPAEHPYGHEALNSKYQGQETVAVSQYAKNNISQSDK